MGQQLGVSRYGAPHTDPLRLPSAPRVTLPTARGGPPPPAPLPPPDLSRPSPHWPHGGRPPHERRFRVYRDLWGRGLHLTAGGKFGGDFLVYPGEPWGGRGARGGGGCCGAVMGPLWGDWAIYPSMGHCGARGGGGAAMGPLWGDWGIYGAAVGRGEVGVAVGQLWGLCGATVNCLWGSCGA